MKDLTHIRDQINHIDQQLLDLISQRTELAQQVAQAKKEINKPILDQQREDEIVSSLQVQKTSLSDACIKTIWKELFAESRRRQEKVLSKKE